MVLEEIQLYLIQNMDILVFLTHILQLLHHIQILQFILVVVVVQSQIVDLVVLVQDQLLIHIQVIKDGTMKMLE